MNRFKVKRKVVLLGDSGVGKTSLIRKFVLDKFDDKYITTIGTKITKKELSIEKENTIIDLTLMIWDVLGQEGYTSIQARSYRGADGVLFVYDLTEQDSLENIKTYWLTELNKVAENVPAVLVGNKVDLQDQRAVDDDMIACFADDLNTTHFLSSAKTGENVETLFKKLGEIVVKNVGIDVQAELEEKDILTLTDAADNIMVDFVESFGDQETAMAIIRQQFKNAGVDISAPTKDSLIRAVNMIAEAERDFKPEKEVNRSLSKRKAMIQRCED